MDATDRALIDALRNDARASYHKLAAAIGLPISTCRLRHRRLEEEGVILGYRAMIPPAHAPEQAVAQISLASGGAPARAALEATMRDLPHIETAWRVSGAADYLLILAAADIAAIRATLDRIGADAAVGRMDVLIKLKHVKGLA